MEISFEKTGQGNPPSGRRKCGQHRRQESQVIASDSLVAVRRNGPRIPGHARLELAVRRRRFDLFERRDAESVDGYVIFNIRHNRYRLITVIHYAKTRNESRPTGMSTFDPS